MSELELAHASPADLLSDIRRLIAEARRQTAVAVNAGLTLLYWRVGKRIHLEVLGNERASYGEQIVVTLSRQLVMEYGRGFQKRICGGWFNLPSRSPKRRLSRHCHDN